MTDSGFSSAASNRYAPAVTLPNLHNSFVPPTKSSPAISSSKENIPRQCPLPKPPPQFQLSRPICPSRSFGARGNGGYSPSVCSPCQNSPISSLADYFCDLNTSREEADTPRKRLSLSSVSSLDSLHMRGHPSPLSLDSATNSPASNAHEDDLRANKGREMAGTKRVSVVATPPARDVCTFTRSSDASLCSTKGRKVLSAENESVRADGAAERVQVKKQKIFFKSISKGCFSDTLASVHQDEVDPKFDPRALQDRDTNVLATRDAKRSSYRRFKSMPIGSKPNVRCQPRIGVHAGKENSPVPADSRQLFAKRLGAVDSPSPLRPMVNSPGSSFQNFTQRRRNSTHFASPKQLTSSPLAAGFSSSSSSAFTSVTHPSMHLPSASKEHSSRQEELRRSAEEKLRDVKSPANVSLTPEKSVVPGSISTLSARPASAAPFYSEKNAPLSYRDVSPILPRGSKRTLDAINTSLIAAKKRHKRSSTSELNSTRRRMAFSSKERKVKSADAVRSPSSPFSSLRSDFRPISAPALMLSDEDIPLTHSRLCSANDSDSDDDDDVMMSLEQSQRLADERLVEEIVSDNNRARREATSDQTMASVDDDDLIGPPDGIDGLITAPLLASATEVEAVANLNNTRVERLPRPRELFRSPSAPPLVPSRRNLLAIKRAQKRNEEITPQGRRRPSNFPALPEIGSHEVEEETCTTLNRSRSFNELDIMKAVEQGCSDDNLIGDFSRVCSLQTVDGKCQDLKYITAETLIDLMDRKADVGKFEIVDCRYPYEYNGGHIKGSTLIWEEEELHKKFLKDRLPHSESNPDGADKPSVLIFYCEFSSERGPRMARALRNKDRCVNFPRYPHLHYPEIYILKNGFKNFYNTPGTENYCEPYSYCPMAHESYARELRLCRIKCKSWAGENKNGMMSRLKRF